MLDINLLLINIIHTRASTQQVGFRRKCHPLIPLFPQDLQHAWQYIQCRYCMDAEPDKPPYTLGKYPSCKSTAAMRSSLCCGLGLFH